MPTVTRQGRQQRLAAQFQADLEASNAAAATRMTASWDLVARRAQDDLDALLAKVEKARAAGQPLSPAWLYQEQRLKSVQASARLALAQHAKAAHTATLEQQAHALDTAADNATALIAADVHPDVLAGGFTRPNPRNLQHLVGHLADGTPLADLLATLPGEAGKGIQTALTQGIVLGWGTDKMRREAQVAMAMPRWRAETIMRTEALRVYRSAAHETYLANADVVEGWVWNASLDGRCCAACVMMDGTIHPLDETLDGHPRCRCAPVPRTKDWAALGATGVEDTRPPVRSGEAWLRAQTPSIQRAVMGKAKHDAWKAGKIDLDDLVAQSSSEAWGTMRRERSLAEIRRGDNPNPPRVQVNDSVTKTPLERMAEQQQRTVPQAPVDDVTLADRRRSEELKAMTDAELRQALTQSMYVQTPDTQRIADEISRRQREVLARAADERARLEAMDESDLLDLALATAKDDPMYRLRAGELKRRIAQREKDAQEALATKTPEWLDSLPRKREVGTNTADILDGARPTTNPNYRVGREYQVNCTHVVSAYELRRRGYDVVASALPREFLARSGRNWDEIYRRWTINTPRADLNRNVLLGTRLQNEKAMVAWGEGARATVRVGWKGRNAGGHVFVAEVRNGKVLYLDPQTGDLAPNYWARVSGKPHYFRMDNLEPSNLLDDLIVKAEAKAPPVPTLPTARQVRTIPDDVLAALVPNRGGYFVATRGKTEAVLKRTPEGRSLLRTLNNFQQGGATSIPRLRTDIEAYLKGGHDLAPGRVEAIEILLDAIKASKVPAGKSLHRGMVVPGDLESVLAKYQAGDNIDLSLSSFTLDPKVAQEFSIKGAGQRTKGAGSKTSVVIEWVGDDMRALPIENLAKSRTVSGEREWIAAGKFRVLDARKAKRGGRDVVVVRMRQTETW